MPSNRSDLYGKLKIWCERGEIGVLPPQPIGQAKQRDLDRFWEEMHYLLPSQLDELASQLSGREVTSSNKEVALKKLYPLLLEVFRVKELNDPEHILNEQRRNVVKRGRSSAPTESEDQQTEESTMSTETVATTKVKKTLTAKKNAVEKKEPVSTGGGISLADIAKKTKVDPADLRRALRSSKIKKPAGSWSWPKGHPDLKAVEKLAGDLK